MQEINAKILYWSIANAGKTASLNFIFGKLRPDHRGNLQTLSMHGKNFQVLPIELGQIQGAATRFQIVSLPDGREDAALRHDLAREALGIIFVVDSQAGKIGENILMFNEMIHVLQTSQIDPKRFPILLQYNKRDNPAAASLEELERKINKFSWPHFESIASRGEGVLQTLSSASKLVIRYLRGGGIPIVAPAAKTPLGNASVSGERTALILREVGPPVKNDDGSVQVTLELIDPKTGAIFSSIARLEGMPHPDGILFKLLPQFRP